ncbi:MAG: CsbD family protein [Dokdonella sp.]|nr:CsbD family protein [Dokdonella sp.]MCB1576671.1 CsbD family protein [Xanthomonadales bacterium]MCB1576676.1 CsbD family protein [Xanthomonadales bacterium]
MNEDRIQGKWKQLKGSIQEKWGKLTNDDLDVAEGNTEYLAGKIQERYGMARDEAKKAVREFEDSL